MASQVLGVSDLAGLAKKAKERPGKLNYATFAPHLFFEWISVKYDVDLFHIPYKSANEVMTELVAGWSDAAYMAAGFAKPYIESGKAKRRTHVATRR
jgi:tripartite-type tricarboxylate transporter receptor subunit TctC